MPDAPDVDAELRADARAAAAAAPVMSEALRARLSVLLAPVLPRPTRSRRRAA